MKSKSSPKLRPTVWDTAVAAVVALLAIGTAVWFYGGLDSSESVTAVITHRGEEVERVDLLALSPTQTVTIEGMYHLTITLTKDGAQVTASDCPTQDCVHTGHISRAGQSIVCLPEQVVVKLEGAQHSDGPDIVLG